MQWCLSLVGANFELYTSLRQYLYLSLISTVWSFRTMSNHKLTSISTFEIAKNQLLSYICINVQKTKNHASLVQLWVSEESGRV